MSYAIEVHNLTKIYPSSGSGEGFLAVDQINFTVKQGENFGFLGPNGAGKTSTLESLEGLRSPDNGSLRAAGIDPSREPRKLRNVLGVQLQTSGSAGEHHRQ